MSDWLLPALAAPVLVALSATRPALRHPRAGRALAACAYVVFCIAGWLFSAHYVR